MKLDIPKFDHFVYLGFRKPADGEFILKILQFEGGIKYYLSHPFASNEESHIYSKYAYRPVEIEDVGNYTMIKVRNEIARCGKILSIERGKNGKLYASIDFRFNFNTTYYCLDFLQVAE